MYSMIDQNPSCRRGVSMGGHPPRCNSPRAMPWRPERHDPSNEEGNCPKSLWWDHLCRKFGWSGCLVWCGVEKQFTLDTPRKENQILVPDQDRLVRYSQQMISVIESGIFLIDPGSGRQQAIWIHRMKPEVLWSQSFQNGSNRLR